MTFCCIGISVILLLFIVTIISLLLTRSKKKSIRGQLALITGGANGIGRGIAFGLAKEGCHIVIADLDFENGQQTAKSIIEKYPGIKVKSYKVDVSSFTEITALKKQIDHDIGRVDILVNNAALLFEAPLLLEKPENFEKMFRVNVLSVFWTLQVFLPAMIANKRGHLVTLASEAAIFGSPKMLMYGTTKFALRGFMETFESELYVQGHSKYIKTSTIFPYFVNSGKDIGNFLSTHWKLPKFLQPYTTDEVANRIMQAIQCEETMVVLPAIFKYVGYYVTIPNTLRKIMFKMFLR